MSLRSLALVAGTLVALAVPVAAEAAYTTGSVNVRTGPSTAYGVITTLPPGVHVGVGRCLRGWCSVSAAGVYGWVSASYIAGGGPRYVAPRYVAPRYVAPYPYYPRVYRPYYPRYAYPYRAYPGFGGYYGSGGSYGFYFSFGPHHRHRW